VKFIEFDLFLRIFSAKKIFNSKFCFYAKIEKKEKKKLLLLILNFFPFFRRKKHFGCITTLLFLDD